LMMQSLAVFLNRLSTGPPIAINTSEPKNHDDLCF
jgi:hypothetical protein